MQDREGTVERLCAKGIVAVVRADSSAQLQNVAKALLAGGVDCIEITLTTPDALATIDQCRHLFGDLALIGAGSVLNPKAARDVVHAGAQFIVGPIFDASVLRTGHAAGLPVVPGAFTPSEIFAAYSAGADMVKVFPATRLGPTYFRDVLAPMPFLRLTPTGGVDLATAGDFIKAGAATLGVGSALVDKKLMKAGDFDAITALAGQFVQAVAAARVEMA
jgi:2-dehydro-3-deoxyphosphogluconate aldolase/(4S)-4-hydroxy-2-oxoglutarate aldolase